MKRVCITKIRRNVCLTLVALMLLMVFPIEVRAADNRQIDAVNAEVLKMTSENRKVIVDTEMSNIRAILHNCLISVYSSSQGMEVSFMTDCTQFASMVGVKDIVIKQKVWYGWKTVATSSGGYNTNDKTFMGNILYTNAIKDEEYRITCTHYADADEYIEVHGELDVIFTY